MRPYPQYFRRLKGQRSAFLFIWLFAIASFLSWWVRDTQDGFFFRSFTVNNGSYVVTSRLGKGVAGHVFRGVPAPQSVRDVDRGQLPIREAHTRPPALQHASTLPPDKVAEEAELPGKVPGLAPETTAHGRLALKRLRKDRDNNWVSGLQEARVRDLLRLHTHTHTHERAHGHADGQVALGDADPHTLPFVSLIEHFQEGEDFWLVYEQMDFNLEAFEMFFYWNPKATREVGCVILKAAEFLAINRVIARDVKPNNFFLSLEKGALKVKWGDFGDAVVLDHLRNSTFTEWWWDVVKRSPSRIFTRPELDWNPSPLTYPVWSYDMWGLGVTLSSLAVGRRFLRRIDSTTTDSFAQDERPRVAALADELENEQSLLVHALRSYGGVEFADLIKKMMSRDPQDRPSPFELLFHEYLIPKGSTLEQELAFTSTEKDALLHALSAAFFNTSQACGRAFHSAHLSLAACYPRQSAAQWHRAASASADCLDYLARARACVSRAHCTDPAIAHTCDAALSAVGPSAPPAAAALAHLCRYAVSFHCATQGAPTESRFFRWDWPPHCNAHSLAGSTYWHAYALKLFRTFFP